MPADMRARLGQTELPNLVLAAAGCAGAGRELAQFVDVARVGALISKSITAEPHTGNPAPRLAETPSGLLNAVGLQNPGIDAFLQRDLPWLLSRGARVVAARPAGPIGGTGGVRIGRDALELLLAGASMIAVGTEIMHGPSACSRVLKELEEELAALGVDRAADVIGLAHGSYGRVSRGTARLA